LYREISRRGDSGSGSQTENFTRGRLLAEEAQLGCLHHYAASLHGPCSRGGVRQICMMRANHGAAACGKSAQELLVGCGRDHTPRSKRPTRSSGAAVRRHKKSDRRLPPSSRLFAEFTPFRRVRPFRRVHALSPSSRPCAEFAPFRRVHPHADFAAGRRPVMCTPLRVLSDDTRRGAPLRHGASGPVAGCYAAACSLRPATRSASVAGLRVFFPPSSSREDFPGAE